MARLTMPPATAVEELGKDAGTADRQHRICVRWGSALSVPDRTRAGACARKAEQQSAAAAADDHQRGWVPGRQERLHPARRPEFLGARMSTDNFEVPKVLSGTGGWLDDRFHGARGVRGRPVRTRPRACPHHLGEDPRSHFGRRAKGIWGSRRQHAEREPDRSKLERFITSSAVHPAAGGDGGWTRPATANPSLSALKRR